MKRPGRDKKRRHGGQASVEFALTLILLMGFMMFFIQLSLIFAWGNYVHYATFMSARAYLSAGPAQQDQKDRAMQVISQMLKKSEQMSGLDRLPAVAKGEGGDEVKGFVTESNDTDMDLSWQIGVRYTFRSRLFLLPLAGRKKGGKDVNSLTLTSESWLGREPAHDECKGIMGGMNGIWDNGC